MRNVAVVWAVLAAALLWHGVARAGAEKGNGVEMTARILASSGEGGETVFTLKAQDGFFRADMEGMSTIFDPKRGEVVTLLHEPKQWVSLPLADAPIAEGGEVDVFDPKKFRPTGRRQTIAGWECEEVVSEEEKAAVWLTKAAGVSREMLAVLEGAGGNQNPMREFLSKTAKFDGVPIRIESLDKEAPFVMTVESLQWKRFEPGEFVPPADYAPLKMPQSIEGLEVIDQPLGEEEGAE